MEVAINLLDKKSHEIFEYNGVLYSLTISSSLPYQVYEKSNKLEVEQHFKYRHYLINGIIYESILTNDYKCFEKEKKEIEQLSLF